MKSMNDHNNNNGSSNSNNNNWFGFSLLPHMKMEDASSSSCSAALPSGNSSFYNLSSSGVCCYGVGDNGNFHYSPLSVMPLKSDGSLCIMEALSRSQTEGIMPNTSPKLEDFLGGAAHDYVSEEREAMALSLESYYNAAAEQQQQNHHIPVHSNSYYSGIPIQGIYHTQLEEEHSKNTQMTQMPEDLKTCWVSRQYSAHPALEHHHMNNVTMVVENGGSGSVNGGMNRGDLQSLTLSMSPGSQTSCVTAPKQISPTQTECAVAAIETKKRGCGKLGQKQPVHRKSIDTFGQRTSQFRGVTRHRWTGRYEAHLWDNSCKKEGQTRKGRQVYLGGYDMEEKAARAYDLAALKYWGSATHINFPLDNYTAQLEEMKNMSRQEYVAHLRRKSSGFSRGASMYRGVTRHHQHGRWQARIGRVAGNKDLYLGTFGTQEEAAEAYDIAAIKFRGANAVTNFDITKYDVEKIMSSNTLLAGEFARRTKVIEPDILAIEHNPPTQNIVEATQTEINNGNSLDWKMALYQSAAQQQANSCAQTVDQKSIGSGSYRNPSFSMALEDYIGVESVHSSQTLMDESARVGAHFSNPSSLVTSLGSSREGSPDKSGSNMLFAKPPLASKFISPTAAAAVSSWFPSAQLRPSAVSMSQLPLFAAWNET
ncbi:AP2-like ethylene-responsive transcription factor ANT [Malus sylvestris]|uniref:AP2-like ethylene-responsive transcription factor ANT n=1 Tax=Malus sylvestris TaxID=3752 RepID=UPI0021ACAC5C|nr:AP2-like ethylene-responsive transcription factor ANT [Malus sylvestris]